MTTEINRGVFSWTNFCETESTQIPNGDTVTFMGDFLAPEIPDSPGDREHVIVRGDRLDKLALDEYGEQLLWWVIAVRNGYDLPDADMVIGEKVIIPDPAIVKSRYIRS